MSEEETKYFGMGIEHIKEKSLSDKRIKWKEQGKAEERKRIIKILNNHDWFCCNYFGGCEKGTCEKDELIKKIEEKKDE